MRRKDCTRTEETGRKQGMQAEENMQTSQKDIADGLLEEKIQETIRRSRNAFYMAEQERTLSYQDFLWIQLKIIPKRWWVFQSFLLLVLFMALRAVPEMLLKRSMGVAASLFVILIIPELWKNRVCGSMEIEAATYYSLRQIYAARMTLFGITDIFLLTLFCGMASVWLGLELSQLVIHFLFPLCVTACICFGILCSRYCFSETMAVVLCLLWSGGWMMIVVNDKIYEKITMPIWFLFLGLAVSVLASAIYRILKNCNGYLEVISDGIENG